MGMRVDDWPRERLSDLFTPIGLPVGAEAPEEIALAIAAAFGALGQAKGLSAAVEGIARNPAASNDIRGNLILGLVLIESLVIYALLVSLILFFVKPFDG